MQRWQIYEHINIGQHGWIGWLAMQACLTAWSEQLFTNLPHFPEAVGTMHLCINGNEDLDMFSQVLAGLLLQISHLY